MVPTTVPTEVPTFKPTLIPTKLPTRMPSIISKVPTYKPSLKPVAVPSSSSSISFVSTVIINANKANIVATNMLSSNTSDGSNVLGTGSSSGILTSKEEGVIVDTHAAILQIPAKYVSIDSVTVVLSTYSIVIHVDVPYDSCMLASY